LSIQVAFDFEALFPDAMRFVPMHLCTAKLAAGVTNQGLTLHFPPVPLPIRAVEVAPDVYTTPPGDGLNRGNLTDDLEVYVVS
jgi:hypothetical protein